MYPGEHLGLSPGEELHVILYAQMVGRKGGRLALSQVNSSINQTFDPGCCGHKMGRWPESGLGGSVLEGLGLY